MLDPPRASGPLFITRSGESWEWLRVPAAQIRREVIVQIPSNVAPESTQTWQDAS